MRTLPSALIATLAAITIGACNHTPISNLEKSFTLRVAKNTGDSEPIKIDFLWVVDNSSSMCQEQVALATNFDRFVEILQSAFDIDPRVAVTTVDAQCDVDGENIVSSKGKFNTVAARTYPRACQTSFRTECRADGECGDLDCEVFGKCGGTQGEWTCDTATEFCVENPNGSFNTTCGRVCTTDEECQTLFDDPQYECQIPSGNTGGCLRQPETATCPETLPPFLTGENLNLFPCIATVGVNSANCLKFEQQMRSGLMAIDPTGINADQAKGFLRPDAYLVIVFVSDEEDCSIADDKSLSEDQYDVCGLLKTTDENGPLVPVAHYVNKFKGLKSDPGRVIVAAIAGDSLLTEPAEIELDRQSYVESKGGERTCFQQSYICSSTNGVADFGARFVELTDAFGPNGSFTNICGESGIEQALEQIAETIVTVVNKVCLPRQILGGLTVTRTRGGSTETLTEGNGSGHYAIIPTSEDCVVDGVIMPAIAFGDPPIPGEVIEITYQGDPQFD